MAMLGLFLTLLLITLHTNPVFSTNVQADVRKWCRETPYPAPCEYFMTQNPGSYGNLKGKKEFHKMSIQLALERALRAHSHTALLGSQCRNELEKTAWADCLELYENTILQLNRTINPTSNCTSFDQQTWLSTALTNLETCWMGFMELGVPDYMLPLMSNNVSKLICNTLAVNEIPPGNDPHTYKDGFPTWLLSGDRKLLQTPTPSSSPSPSPSPAPAPSPTSQVDLVVAQDGLGDFKTITEAVEAIPSRRNGRFVIYVKVGTYEENVQIGDSNIMFVGDGIGKTIVTGSRSVQGGSTTFNSATVAVTGDGFIARDMTFINTAGPSNHQAVALRSGSDFSVFYRCSFEGYQDTLYSHSQRQFYKECDVYGTVDFIFGNAAVVLQDCNIYARKPMDGQKNTITAQGRTDPNQNTGISIHNSRVMAASDPKPDQNNQSSIQTYLGRPWKKYSRTVFLQTFLDSLIDPAGWLEWDGNFALKTLYYGEYKNTGPGSSTSYRVEWGGYHVITNATEASEFSVSNFISGNSWLPATNIPFIADL